MLRSGYPDASQIWPGIGQLLIIPLNGVETRTSVVTLRGSSIGLSSDCCMHQP